MQKKVINYRGKDGHSDIVVYKFDNTAEDQKLAQDVSNKGKAPIGVRPNVPGLSYVLPTSIPAYYYSQYENKKFRKDGYNHG